MNNIRRFMTALAFSLVASAHAAGNQADPLIATVYGKPVRLSTVRFGSLSSFDAKDADKALLFYRQGVEATIIQPVLDRYAQTSYAKQYQATSEQSSALKARLVKLGAKAQLSLPPNNTYWDTSAKQESQSWALRAAVYRQYGGAVSYRIEGLYPGEAVSRLIADEMKRGNLKIFNENDRFLLAHLNSGNQIVHPTTAEYFFSKPWWQRETLDLQSHGFFFQPTGFGFMCASALDEKTLRILTGGPAKTTKP